MTMAATLGIADVAAGILSLVLASSLLSFLLSFSIVAADVAGFTVQLDFEAHYDAKHTRSLPVRVHAGSREPEPAGTAERFHDVPRMRKPGI
jgi:hypothetical protein